MTSEQKNRFHFDDDFDPAAGVTIYPDEEDRFRKARRYRYVVTALLSVLLLGLVGYGGYYVYNRYLSSSGEGVAGERKETLLDKKLGQLNLEGLKDQLYMPSETVGPELSTAIQHYKTNNRDQARREFEKFIEGGGSDHEKAIALVYSGIMALETERYTLAQHELQRALKYDEKYVPALVNLAIAELKLGNLEEARKYVTRAKEIAPDDSQVAIVLGNLLARSKDLPGAIELFKKGLSDRPDDPALYYNLALSLLESQKYDEAILYFSKAIEKAGVGEIAVQSHAHLAQIYFFKGNLEIAADHLNTALKMAPENGRYHYNLGVIYMRLKRMDEAYLHFKMALESGSDDAIVYKSLAQLYIDSKHPSLAVQALQKALYRNPEDIASLFMLGDLYAEEKEYLAAVETYRKIVKLTPGDQNTEDALIKLGRVYTRLERFNDASETLREELRINPGSVEAKYTLGLALYESGRMDLAIETWREAVAAGDGISMGSHIERKDERLIRFALAQVYAKEGAYDLALQQLRIVQDRNTEKPAIEEDPELDLRIAEVYHAGRDKENALLYYHRVVESRSADSATRKATHIGLARLLSETGHREDLDEARKNGALALRIAPDDPAVVVLNAEILLKTDSVVDREKAIEILMAIAASDIDAKTAAKVHNLLGEAHYRNGEFSRALHEFDYAVKLDPSLTEAFENRRAAAGAYEQSIRR